MPPLDFPSSPTNGQYYNGFVYNAANDTWDSAYAPRAATIPISSDNVIINGAFDIWQRGTSFTANGFVADRWKLDKPSGVTVSRETSDVPSGFQYALKQVSTSSNAYTQLGQQIEFANCAALQSKTVTISFWMKALANTAGSTNVIVRTRRADAVDSAVIFSGTNNDNSITISTSWNRYTVTKTLVTFGAMSLEFALPANVTGDGFLVTGVQLEAGAAATDFRRNAPSIQAELAACQRYYWRSTAIAPYTNFASAVAGNATNGDIFFNFPVPMRDRPATFESSAASTFLLGNSVTFTSLSYSTSYSNNMSALVGYSGTTGLSAYQSLKFFSNNSTTSYVGFSAEL